MSALDILRSFAESRSGDTEVICDGITYGTAREIVKGYAAANKQVAELEAIKWLDDFSDQQWLVHVEFLPEGPQYEASSCAATFRASTPLAALTGLVARLQKERAK